MYALYVVATPIGNLEDITLRAIRVLGEVGLIAAEDTRKTRRLLDQYGIKTSLTSYYEHNKVSKLPLLLEHLKRHDVALVSDAGTPGVSDPGHEIILAAIEQGNPVIPIPGASAIMVALMVSGLPSDKFTYLGFLPRKESARLRLLKVVAEEPHTLVLFETPHRLVKSLSNMVSMMGDRRIAIIREATKFHEEVFRGRITEALDHFRQPRGEFTLVIEGRQEPKETDVPLDLEKQIKDLQSQGASFKEAMAMLGQSAGLSRKELYRRWLQAKRSSKPSL